MEGGSGGRVGVGEGGSGGRVGVGEEVGGRASQLGAPGYAPPPYFWESLQRN